MTTVPQTARALLTVSRHRRRQDSTVGTTTEADGAAAAGAAVGTADALDDARALERSLRDIVVTLQRVLERVDPPVTPVQLWCLRELRARGSTTVGDVAAAVGVVPSTASRAADRLVAAGLVSRRTGHGDRRQVALRLTAGGGRLLDEVSEERARALRGTLARMDDDDRAALLRGAEAFAAADAPPAGDGREP